MTNIPPSVSVLPNQFTSTGPMKRCIDDSNHLDYPTSSYDLRSTSSIKNVLNQSNSRQNGYECSPRNRIKLKCTKSNENSLSMNKLTQLFHDIDDFHPFDVTSPGLSAVNSFKIWCSPAHSYPNFSPGNSTLFKSYPDDHSSSETRNIIKSIDSNDIPYSVRPSNDSTQISSDNLNLRSLSIPNLTSRSKSLSLLHRTNRSWAKRRHNTQLSNLNTNQLFFGDLTMNSTHFDPPDISTSQENPSLNSNEFHQHQNIHHKQKSIRLQHPSSTDQPPDTQNYTFHHNSNPAKKSSALTHVPYPLRKKNKVELPTRQDADNFACPPSESFSTMDIPDALHTSHTSSFSCYSDLKTDPHERINKLRNNQINNILEYSNILSYPSRISNDFDKYRNQYTLFQPLFHSHENSTSCENPTSSKESTVNCAVHDACAHPSIHSTASQLDQNLIISDGTDYLKTTYPFLFDESILNPPQQISTTIQPPETTHSLFNLDGYYTSHNSCYIQNLNPEIQLPNDNPPSYITQSSQESNETLSTHLNQSLDFQLHPQLNSNMTNNSNGHSHPTTQSTLSFLENDSSYSQQTVLTSVDDYHTHTETSTVNHASKSELSTFIKHLKIDNKILQEIDHSSKFADDVYEYRFVVLPRNHPFFNFEKKEELNDYILSESEWRALGIRQTRGWEHFGYSRHESHIFLFRRPLNTDPHTGIIPDDIKTKVKERLSNIKQWMFETTSLQNHIPKLNDMLLNTVSSFGSTLPLEIIDPQTNSQILLSLPQALISAYSLFKLNVQRNFVATMADSHYRCIEEPSLPHFDLSDNDHEYLFSSKTFKSNHQILTPNNNQDQLKSPANHNVVMSPILSTNTTDRDNILHDLNRLYASIHMPLYAE